MVASIIFLLLLIYILIQVPAVQNFARKKVVSYLENKIHTKVQINKLSLDFPKRLVLEGVYFEDQKKDTLFSGGKIQVDIALLKLLRNKVEVSYINLKDINAKIYRSGNDSIFNYQYIINAFASQPDSTTVDTSAGMKISVDKIELENVAASFKDEQTGVDFSGRLGKFQTAFKQFDLDKMLFSLPDITLENVSGHMYQNKPLMKPQPMAEVEAESNKPFDLGLSLQNINLKKIKFDYRNDISLLFANLDLGELSGKVRSIDLAKLVVQLENVKLHNTNTAIALGKSEQTKVVKKEIKKEVKAQANNPWKVSIANIDLENNNLVYNDDNNPRLSGGMDYSHLKIDRLTLKGNNFLITPTTYTGNITTGAFREQSGFDLKQLRTGFAYSDTGAVLNNLFIQTDKTILRDNITIKYPSLEAVTKDVGKLYIDASLPKVDLAAKDILIFAPQLRTNLKGYENAVIKLNGRVKGYLNNLTIPGFTVSGIGNTMLSMSGTIKGLPDMNKTVYNFNITNLQTTKADLAKLIPSGTIPANIRIPDAIKMSGSFKGLATNFTTNLLLQTNKGNARLAGYLNSNSETYDLKGSLDQVDVGYLMMQDTLLGKVTMRFASKGKGFRPAKMNTNMNANIQSAFIKGYNYQNLDLTASVHNGYTVINAGMGDKSLAFHLDGEALIGDKSAGNIKMRLQLDSILLQPLGFANTDLRLHGDIIADIPAADMNAPEGTIQVSDLVVSNNGKRYTADTITIAANTNDTGKVLTLNSQIASATLAGNFNVATLATSAMQVINKYYDLGIKDTAISNDQWSLNAIIIPDSLLFAFVPSLSGTDTVSVKGEFDGSAEKMNLLVNAPKVQLGEIALDSLTVTAGNTGDKFVYAATVHSLGTKSFRVHTTSLNGFIANNELTAAINAKDIDGNDKYQLGARLAQEKNGALRASLADTLMLNYTKWSVDNTNYIRYDSKGIMVHNFSIHNGGQSLSINSTTESETAPIDVVLKDFHIKTFANLLKMDSLALDGTINGNILVKDVMTTPVFTAHIAIDTLVLNADTVGNITVNVDNETASTFNTGIAITGNGNDVKLAGKYYTGESRMDMILDINNFNMTSLRPFSFGAIREADGSLKGKLVIKGTADDPDLDGSIRFENAHITPKATGEKLLLSNEEIHASSGGIRFDHFTMVDSAGNKAIIDGNIYTKDFQTYNFNLDLTADNFRAFTAPPRQDALYYGDLNIDADASIRGTLTAPKVNLDLKINKTTNMTFVLPSANPEVVSREGVVEFVDVYGGKKDSVITITDTVARFAELAGIDFTGTLESDTSAQINLVIDERSGDILKIRGKADLAVAFDKSGKLSFTGNYQLQRGSYQLTLSILKRQFIIQPGSIITWTGDPMSATVDITAMYLARTEPINLLQNELANLSQSEVNKYKTKLPFNVLLKMKGDLMKPVISFDIVLPATEQTKWDEVETKLEQLRRNDAELNKQVFALLLLNRFVQENPLESAASTTMSTAAKTSVSRILTDQLNNLAGSLIKGVDLNFGVNAEDDYSSGSKVSRTDLTVGVSKQLLNDRLRVTVGSSIALEGTNSNEKSTNIGGDVQVDYLLTKDGRYTLRAYNQNHYEGVIDGEVMESGVGLIFSFDFNEFKQILNRKTEEEKRMEEKRKAAKQAAEQKKNTTSER